MKQIPLEEIRFHPSSQADPSGRLFEWQGKLYRGIAEEHAPFFRKLFSDGIIDRLVGKGLLVPTAMESFTMPGYPLVLGHARVPFVSYPYEWTPRMLQDAAQLILSVNMELADHGLTTPDGHAWNVLFDNGKPLFVDVGSIVRRGEHDSWGPDEEFQRFCLRPLRLFERNEHRLARWLLRDHQGVGEDDLLHIGLPTVHRAAGYFKLRAKRFLKRELKRRGWSPAPKATASSRSMKSELEQLSREVASISLPSPVTEWGDYYERSAFPSFTDRSQWTNKNNSVATVLGQMKPATTLDVAGNRGWFSQMAAHLGCKVITYDNDEGAMERLYSEVKNHTLSILPVVGDLLSPTPERTWLGRGRPLSASERFQSDMVLALAITHHMAFRFSIPMRFDKIVDTLEGFSRRWLVAEFIPPDDVHVAPWMTDAYKWYSLDNFTAALNKRFRILTQLPSHPSPRVLLVCERKNT